MATRKPDPPEGDEDEPKPPVEPNGFDLTRRRSNIDHAKEKMQKTADEITRLLQDEQRRQSKYRKDKQK